MYERMKKSGGANPFNLFVIAEMECMHRLLAAVRESLLVNHTIFVLCILKCHSSHTRTLGLVRGFPGLFGLGWGVGGGVDDCPHHNF